MTLVSVITTDNTEILGSVVYTHNAPRSVLENDNCLTLAKAVWIRRNDDTGTATITKISDKQDFRAPGLKNTITFFSHNIICVINVTDKRVIDEYTRIIKEYQNDE